MAGRQKAEKTLLRCMLASPEWSERIVDLYPPDDWHFPDLAAAAGVMREAWTAGRPDLATLTAATTNEEVRGALLGLLDPAPPPTADEMNLILERGENEARARKKQRLQEEIRRAALNKNEAELATLHAALRDQQTRGRRVE
ncbi:MAG: hypothetical protein LBP75_02045 [Planctomycetota bacterium]|jgi:hypothetical protein|nr:hypothetical protein [Planctomycetota bacterium]